MPSPNKRRLIKRDSSIHVSEDKLHHPLQKSQNVAKIDSGNLGRRATLKSNITHFADSLTGASPSRYLPATFHICFPKPGEVSVCGPWGGYACQSRLSDQDSFDDPSLPTNTTHTHKERDQVLDLEKRRLVFVVLIIRGD